MFALYSMPPALNPENVLLAKDAIYVELLLQKPRQGRNIFAGSMASP